MCIPDFVNSITCWQTKRTSWSNIKHFQRVSQQPAQATVTSEAKTSVSSSSMTSMTKFKLSMKELTATRSMRFVVALYSTCRVWSKSPEASSLVAAIEKVLRTRGDNSLSTCSDLRATDARRAVGKGTSSVLEEG